jgi:hypothetical protein
MANCRLRTLHLQFASRAKKSAGNTLVRVDEVYHRVCIVLSGALLVSPPLSLLVSPPLSPLASVRQSSIILRLLYACLCVCVFVCVYILRITSVSVVGEGCGWLAICFRGVSVCYIEA